MRNVGLMGCVSLYFISTDAGPAAGDLLVPQRHAAEGRQVPGDVVVGIWSGRGVVVGDGIDQLALDAHRHADHVDAHAPAHPAHPLGKLHVPSAERRARYRAALRNAA